MGSGIILVSVMVKDGPFFHLSLGCFPLSFTLRGVGISVYLVLFVYRFPFFFFYFFVFAASRGQASFFFFFGVWLVGFVFCGLLLFIVVLGTFDLVGSGYLGT